MSVLQSSFIRALFRWPLAAVQTMEEGGEIEGTFECSARRDSRELRHMPKQDSVVSVAMPGPAARNGGEDTISAARVQSPLPIMDGLLGPKRCSSPSRREGGSGSISMRQGQR